MDGSRGKGDQNDTSSASLSPIMQSINPSHCRVVDMDIGTFNNQIPEIRAWFVSGRDVSPCDESYF